MLFTFFFICHFILGIIKIYFSISIILRYSCIGKEICYNLTVKENDVQQEDERFEENREIIGGILHVFAVYTDACVGGRKSGICITGAGLVMYSICRAFVMHSGHAIDSR